MSSTQEVLRVRLTCIVYHAVLYVVSRDVMMHTGSPALVIVPFITGHRENQTVIASAGTVCTSAHSPMRAPPPQPRVPFPRDGFHINQDPRVRRGK